MFLVSNSLDENQTGMEAGIYDASRKSLSNDSVQFYLESYTRVVKVKLCDSYYIELHHLILVWENI